MHIAYAQYVYNYTRASVRFSTPNIFYADAIAWPNECECTNKPSERIFCIRSIHITFYSIEWKMMGKLNVMAIVMSIPWAMYRKFVGNQTEMRER